MANRRKLLDPAALHSEMESALARDRSAPHDVEAAKPLKFSGATLKMLSAAILSAVGHLGKRTTSALQEVDDRAESTDQLLTDLAQRVEKLEERLR
jgi:hypothetical protein